MIYFVCKTCVTDEWLWVTFVAKRWVGWVKLLNQCCSPARKSQVIFIWNPLPWRPWRKGGEGTHVSFHGAVLVVCVTNQITVSLCLLLSVTASVHLSGPQRAEKTKYHSNMPGQQHTPYARLSGAWIRPKLNLFLRNFCFFGNYGHESTLRMLVNCSRRSQYGCF